MAVVNPTDRSKMVRNRCVIELCCGVVCVVTLPFWHLNSAGIGAFVKGLSQISSFFYMSITGFSLRAGTRWNTAASTIKSRRFKFPPTPNLIILINYQSWKQQSSWSLTSQWSYVFCNFHCLYHINAYFSHMANVKYMYIKFMVFSTLSHSGLSNRLSLEWHCMSLLTLE